MFGSFESLYFTFQSVGDVVVARCTLANLSDEENIEEVGQELLTIIGKYECRELIVDFADVEYITSSMVGKLIRVHRQLHRDGGKLVICNLSPTVDEILRTSNLLTYFNAAQSVTEAALLFGDPASESENDDDDPDAPENIDTVDEF